MHLCHDASHFWLHPAGQIVGSECKCWSALSWPQHNFSAPPSLVLCTLAATITEKCKGHMSRIRETLTLSACVDSSTNAGGREGGREGGLLVGRRRPSKKIAWRGDNKHTYNIYTDIPTTRLTRPRGQVSENWEFWRFLRPKTNLTRTDMWYLSVMLQLLRFYSPFHGPSLKKLFWYNDLPT